MNKKSQLSFVVLLLLAIFMLSTQSVAGSFTYKNEKVTEGDMIAEWLVRPAGAIGIVAGFATFAVGLPFSVMADNTEESYDLLVKEPFTYTFHRPLGHYSSEGNH